MFINGFDLEKISLKYADDVPEGYDISQMQYTFDFIYLVLKRNSGIDEAISGVAMEYGLHESDLKDYLIENKYILNNADRNVLSQQIKKHNTKSLKKILKRHGLRTSGKREQIEKRIFENGLFGVDYYLSSKSKVFYKNKKRRIRIFSEYLSDYYYFDEFNEFYMNNFRKKEANIPIAFINQHIDKSIEDENHMGYIFNNHIMSLHFFKKEEYRKALEYVLKIYCMNLNPIWKLDGLDGHVGVFMETYLNLIFLEEELDRNTIISTYYLVWDSFDFERQIISKYDGYRYLKDILHQKDYYRINSNLDSQFYSNRDVKIKKITQKTLFDF